MSASKTKSVSEEVSQQILTEQLGALREWITENSGISEFSLLRRGSIDGLLLFLSGFAD